MASTATVPEGSTAQWTDRKRYLWLLGLVVPSLAFLAWGLVALTGWSVFWFLGPIVVFVVVPAVDLVAGLDSQQPAGRRPRGARERPLLPLDHLPLPADPVRRAGVGVPGCSRRHPQHRRQGRPGDDGGHHRRHRDQHRPRARPQEGVARALAGQDRAGAELLRPLLHRAQPRPPRAGRDPGGPGQRPVRRELLRVLAAHRGRLAALGAGAWRSAGSQRRRLQRLDAAQRRAQRLADVVVLWGALVVGLRPRHPAVPGDPGGHRLLAARGR